MKKIIKKAMYALGAIEEKDTDLKAWDVLFSVLMLSIVVAASIFVIARCALPVWITIVFVASVITAVTMIHIDMVEYDREFG